MPLELNIFAEVAVNVGNHGVILGYLNDIIAEINILIGGVEVYTTVELDISVTVFAGIVCDLIKVRHCFHFYFLTIFYSMRYSSAYRECLKPCDQH